MSHVGINIGALTVKAVILGEDGQPPRARVVAHQGRPAETLDAMLAKEFAGAESYGVSGPRGPIAESAAIQRALREVPGPFDAVASLGGESFLVYVLTGGRITGVLSHNQCAAGSGEFLVQQTGRMGLTLEEAVRRSAGGRLVPLAGRCSVHCKSDVTHKLNRHEASVEDVLFSLHDVLAAKVDALLEQSRREPRRVLLIGGVTRNPALVAALRGRRPGTEFVVLPESPWFEAWGSALLARDGAEGGHELPRLDLVPSLGTLPPLSDFADRVRVLPAPPLAPPPDGPLVLGVDAGSTTTKAVLLDPATRAVVAAHYTRTRGDPVAATRECLQALAGQVGDRPVDRIGATGSARELVGAYLATPHVHNEITCHAAGAAHFDPEVDTIFEIGGQDAKYIRLHNGVPLDYAMNNACSAGTGSFLEESAKGDLGIPLEEIADLALAAKAPVQFKATCAAFINSDIRVAQHQGYARDDVVAGLVYAIAANYLNRVKGPRPVGKKVFLQGGVALNRAVGYAFAQRVERPVVIPPRPELLGALGAGLVALERGSAAGGAAVALSALAARELARVGAFTCGACGLACTVDRFELDGRRFPFGGRCSLFENVRHQRGPARPAADLVARREALILGRTPAPEGPLLGRLGIPRALTTHALYPLYAAFFAGLGLEVVLSGVDPGGDRKTYSSFCFPVQIAHGAVLDLARRGIDRVFLPHVRRMPRAADCRESFLCPISQAGPYVLAKAFPGLRFLSPLLDFSDGYEGCRALVDLALENWPVGRARAERAWGQAVRAQEVAEAGLRQLSGQALEQALHAGGLAVVLAGHSYNAYTAEASQSVGRKLASMGVPVIPADGLTPVEDGPTAWHYANQVLNAAAVCRRHVNLFLVCVSNFGCTVDAFAQAQLAEVLGAKPYLVLEIDAHTADAGTQTRLEAFLDIARHYHESETRTGGGFQPCRIASSGHVVRSSGEALRLDDPRVRLYFNNFSTPHAAAAAAAMGWLGLHAAPVAPLSRAQLDRGLRYSSGRECLPLPLSIGQMLDIHEHRRPDEVVGYFMLTGGAPCVLDAYRGYFERLIAGEGLADLFLFVPGAPEFDQALRLCGLDTVRMLKTVVPALMVADLLVEAEHALRVVGGPGALEGLRAAWEELLGCCRSWEQFHAALPGFVARLGALPRRGDAADCPRVVITGDFFTRFSPFFHEGVAEVYARHGIVLKPVDLGELLLFLTYHSMADTAGEWGLRPGPWAVGKACLRLLHQDGRGYLKRWLAYRQGQELEDSLRSLFAASGLVSPHRADIPTAFARGAEHVSPAIFGEALPTVGEGVEAEDNGYDGILILGPFNCLPLRVSEAILKPLALERGMPVLTYESDGCAVPPSFLRQVEVHAQQVREHGAGRRPAVPARG